MYKVIEYFVDLQDNDREYNVGDTFNHENVSASILRFLASSLSSDTFISDNLVCSSTRSMSGLRWRLFLVDNSVNLSSLTFS
jgi:hypothetical protein